MTNQNKIVKLYSSIKTIKPRGAGPDREIRSITPRPLLPVHTIADIERFHSKHFGHRLHDDFIFYLTNISSETISSQQTFIDLANPEWCSLDVDWLQNGKHCESNSNITEIEKDDSIYVGDCYNGMANRILVTDTKSPYWGHVFHTCPDYFDWPYPYTMTSAEFLLDVDSRLLQMKSENKS